MFFRQKLLNTNKTRLFAQKTILLFLPIKFLPFQQLQALWTLFSEFFSSFPHGTCSLSVSHHRYLASDGVYHLKLNSLSCTLKQLDSFTRKKKRISFLTTMPCYTKICFAYGSITLYSSFFQIKKRQVPFEFRRVKVVLRTWPFVYTTSLRSIPARRKFSAWALVTFLFIRHYSGNHRYFLFPLHLLRCFNSVGCSYLNWNRKRQSE